MELVFLVLTSVMMMLYGVGLAAFIFKRMGAKIQHLRTAGMDDIATGLLNRLKLLTQQITHVSDAQVHSQYAFSEATDRITVLERETGTIQSAITTIIRSQKMTTEHFIQISDKISSIATTNKSVSEQVKTLDGRYAGLLPEAENQKEPPVAIHVAIAKLTPTELAILVYLAREGSKPAPEIQLQLHRTREHTARLMKQMFLDGFVERDQSSIPYRYKLKEYFREAVLQSAARAEPVP